MITNEMKHSVLALYQQGVGIRQISRILKVSRNAVRRIVRGKTQQGVIKPSPCEPLLPLIRELFSLCKGNVVRVQEILHHTHGESIPYSTLTRIVRELDLREKKNTERVGHYDFAPGKESQHDTSPHKVILGGKRVKAQCAGLVLAYSRKLFIQYYPAFTRFECKVFLSDAFTFMDATAPTCIIDNTSVIVAHGSGPDAEIAPEMERFGQIFRVRFLPHAIGDADRKARMERNFSYVERNFLPGRSFTDWHDLNEQAKQWCIEVANKKPKRSLAMSPDEAYLMERPHLQPLPPYIPPVYQTLYRVVDVAGYVAVDTNRYSVPERLIGKQVEVHKTWDRILVFFKDKTVADHPRVIDKRNTRSTAKGHHPPLNRQKAHQGPCQEETILRGYSPSLKHYVEAIKRHVPGRGVRHMRRLLELKRTYPENAFTKALQQALHYGLYDLSRLEQIILSHVAGDFFNIDEDDD